MGSHVPTSSGSQEMTWLSVASHTRLSMGSRMWSSGSSLKWSMRSSRVSRTQTPTPSVGVTSLQT
ncbi:hypothetical protein PI125_g10450 [Phytophthora idaei]|nr:hypothetical protein PI125_g10450 [Phytophthora idaei]